MMRPTIWGAAALVAVLAQGAQAQELTKEAVNEAAFEEGVGRTEGQSPLMLKTQVLLDRAGTSPGVIDGYAGENVDKAITSFEAREGFEVDGKLDSEVWKALNQGDGGAVLVEYEITEEDLKGPFVDEIPEDYAKMAEMESLAFTSPSEMFAERFHMDEDLLKSLNPEADFGKAGTSILVADPGEDLSGAVKRIEVANDKGLVRAYDAEDKLLASYPATVGSEQTPSPSGTHEITAVAIDPTYTYRPDVNFQQGDNDEPLTLPPGPNGPVGSVWIDLSKPTYGIHGTPEPAEIDKSASHGCVRLTNWDAKELANLVSEGVKVEFQAGATQ